MQSNEEKNGDINISEDESPTQNKQNKNLDDVNCILLDYYTD